MLKQFSLRLGEAEAAVQFDLLNLIVANGCYCNNLTAGVSLRVSLFFPAACMPRPSNMRAARGLGLTNRHSATKKSLKLVLIFHKVFLKIHT